MSTASILENVNPRSTVDQFDKEFRRYTTVQVRLLNTHERPRKAPHSKAHADAFSYDNNNNRAARARVP